MTQRHPDPVVARLVDRGLHGSLKRFLGSKGIPESDAVEIIDCARMQLFEKGLPREPEEVDRLLFCIAGRRAVDFHRDRAAQKNDGLRAIPGMTYGKGEEPSVPLEVIEQLHDLQRFAKGNPRHKLALQAMVEKMTGKKLETFASEHGVPTATLRQWISRFREDARQWHEEKPMREYERFLAEWKRWAREPRKTDARRPVKNGTPEIPKIAEQSGDEESLCVTKRPPTDNPVRERKKTTRRGRAVTPPTPAPHASDVSTCDVADLSPKELR